MVAIAVALKNISLSNIVFVEYPTKSNPAYPGRVVPEEPADNIVNSALDNDQPVVLAGRLGRATVAGPAITTAPTGAATATPTAAATSASNAVELPADVTGQTAAQSTCARGYRP
jgi:hypothetical protein